MLPRLGPASRHSSGGKLRVVVSIAGVKIREARSDELTLLPKIEEESEALFAEAGIGPFTEDDIEGYLAQAAVILVAGDPPVGFACVEIVDDAAHLRQLSVLPSFGRRGIGTALVRAVGEWATSEEYAAVTLTTYRDVPWNGPFYYRQGFRTVSELTPGLAIIRDHEKAIGDDEFGPRVAMRWDLTRPVTG
jgi:GNAT superfamily N-acetyltransferase